MLAPTVKCILGKKKGVLLILGVRSLRIRRKLYNCFYFFLNGYLFHVSEKHY